MNKYIKNKKKDKLFSKKYPRLYEICKVNNINKKTVDKTYKRISRLGILTKEEIINAIRMTIVAREKKYTFKKDSIGEYYKNIFEKIKVKL